MKAITKLFALIAIIFLTSCNENPATDANTADTESVKKMSTDSNSAMPVETPKDSTAKMPNSMNSIKK